MPLETGRQVVVREPADSPAEAIDQVTLAPQAPPDPARLGPTDVIVRVRAAQVGWVDLLMTAGRYQHAPAFPYRPGMEWAGEVVHVGAGVTTLAPGDRVIADGLRTGPRSSSHHQAEGGFGTWATADASALIPLPEGLDFAGGASLLGSYETATHALRACGRVGEGEVVLILGASGATGLAAVHVAKRLGATVIATGRSRDKLDVVLQEGADHAICTAEGPGALRDEVRAVTGGRGCDVVYDPVGGPSSVEALRALRFGGRFLVVGWAATPDVAKTGANVLPTNLILMKGLSVIGSPAVISTQRDPSIRPPRLRWVLDQVSAGLRPRIAEVRDLGEIRAALRSKWEGRLVGSIVLTP